MRRLLILVLTMLAAGPAAADVTRVDAERLASEGKASHDPAKLLACGQAYVDLYNADPDAADGDELIAGGAACFEDTKNVNVAVQLYDQLRTRWPQSPHAATATWQVARIYARVGLLDKAADRLEDYASRWSAAPHAFDALAEAIELRAALGDEAKQIALVRKLQVQFGRTRPHEAAAATSSLSPIYERQGGDALVKHLRDYLRLHGTTGSPEDTVDAYARLGTALWQRSCPVPLIDGLCVRLERVRPAATRARPASHCGSPAAASYTVVPRAPGLVKQAAAAFTAVVTATPTPANATTQRALATALLHQADQELETYLAVRFPTGLDFTPDRKQVRQASLERFNAYLTRKQQLGALATTKYSAVVATKLGPPMVAALGRLGMISQAMSEDLSGAEIPKALRTGEFASDKIAAFCAQMTAVAKPLMKRAIDAYDLCLIRSSERGIVDAASRLCERERVRLAPSPFARTRELQAAPAPALPILTEPAVPAGKAWPRPLAEALGKLDPRGAPIAKPICGTLVAQLTALDNRQAQVDARYLLGLVFARCGMVAEAKRAYERVLELQPAHPAATSNLGELAWRAGSWQAAKQLWRAALAADGKLFAARVNLASAGLRELAAMTARDPNRRALEDDVRSQASNAAAVTDHPAPLVVLALLGYASADPKHHGLAPYFLRRARLLDDGSPYVDLARGVIDPGVALDAFQRAAAAVPDLEEAHQDLGLTYLMLRRPDEASAELARVTTRSYDVLVARGIAARRMARHADAEARYAEAIALDPARPEAHFNLGVLWEDSAMRGTDPATSKLAYRKAAEAFRRARTPEANQLAVACDQAVAALAP